MPLGALQDPELSTEEAKGVLDVLCILRQGLTLEPWLTYHLPASFSYVLNNRNSPLHQAPRFLRKEE